MFASLYLKSNIKFVVVTSGLEIHGNLRVYFLAIPSFFCLSPFMPVIIQT